VFDCRLISIINFARIYDTVRLYRRFERNFLNIKYCKCGNVLKLGYYIWQLSKLTQSHSSRISEIASFQLIRVNEVSIFIYVLIIFIVSMRCEDSDYCNKSWKNAPLLSLLMPWCLGHR